MEFAIATLRANAITNGKIRINYGEIKLEQNVYLIRSFGRFGDMAVSSSACARLRSCAHSDMYACQFAVASSSKPAENIIDIKREVVKPQPDFSRGHMCALRMCARVV